MEPVKVRAVFLDRDGVINEAILRGGKPYPPADINELKLAPRAAEALASLRALGFLLIVVTNQPDVRRGKTSRSSVDQIHEWLTARLPIDDVFTCWHDDEDACNCRKPLPGLLLEAGAKYGIDLQASYMVGDRWRDIEAGFAAGCRTILIDHRYNEQGPKQTPDGIVLSLEDAVTWLKSEEEKLSESRLRS